MTSSTRIRVIAAVVVAAAAALLIGQLRAIETEGFNWDAFALLARAQDTVRSGALRGGGRPGLVSLALIPFVRDCADAVAAMRAARVAWLAITVLYLAGIFVLVRGMTPPGERRWPPAAAAVAAIAAVPVFLRWSLQVRTDQPALLFATWGSVALLTAPPTFTFAALAGGLFGVAYLCTQKAAYIVIAALVLYALRVAPDFNWRQMSRAQVVRPVVAGAVALTTVVVFNGLIWLFFDPPVTVTLQSQLNIFAYYQQLFGYRAYRAMLPSLVPHILLAVLLFVALVVSGRRPLRTRAAIVACWVMLLLGFAIGVFHRGAFPYFWMTLGFFAAVALGLGWPALFEVFGSTTAGLAVAAAAVATVVSVGPAALALQQDTQRVQREAFAFIERHFPPPARGFQTDGGLFCRPDPDPFPTYFADANSRFFSGPEGQQRVAAFIEEFRRRPVAFMVINRMFSFPEPIQTFMNEHYALYGAEVMVPGQPFAGARGSTHAFDVIVPGTYRWHTSSATAIRVDDHVLGRDQIVHLSNGAHTVTLLDDVASGLFALALNEAPHPNGPPFYAPAAIKELDPLYPRGRR